MTRISWWPKGHQLSLQEALDRAENEADRAQAELDQAIARGSNRETIAAFAKTATDARCAYYSALNTDLAL